MNGAVTSKVHKSGRTLAKKTRKSVCRQHRLGNHWALLCVPCPMGYFTTRSISCQDEELQTKRDDEDAL
eukprot:2201474-Amphidinium_carterae.1